MPMPQPAMPIVFRDHPCTLVGCAEILPEVADLAGCFDHLLARCWPDDLPRPLTPSGLREVFVARECLGSTAIGHGLATPEADLRDWDGRVRMLVGWSRTPMGFWDSLDGEPVWLVIASLVPLPRSSKALAALCNLHRQVSRSMIPAVPPPLGETLARRGGEEVLRFLVEHLDPRLPGM